MDHKPLKRKTTHVDVQAHIHCIKSGTAITHVYLLQVYQVQHTKKSATSWSFFHFPILDSQLNTKRTNDRQILMHLESQCKFCVSLCSFRIFIIYMYKVLDGHRNTNFIKYSQYGQIYEDTWSLHVHLTVRHRIPQPWAVGIWSHSATMCVQPLMSGDKAWLWVSAPDHPKICLMGLGKGSVQASRALSHQIQKSISYFPIWGAVMCKQERNFLKLLPNVGSTLLCNISLCA